MLVSHWQPSQAQTMREDTKQNPHMIDPWAFNPWPFNYRIFVRRPGTPSPHVSSSLRWSVKDPKSHQVLNPFLWSSCDCHPLLSKLLRKNLTTETIVPTFVWFSSQLQAVPKAIPGARPTRSAVVAENTSTGPSILVQCLATPVGLAVCHQKLEDSERPGHVVIRPCSYWDKRPPGWPSTLCRISCLGSVGFRVWKNASQRTWQAARSLKKLLEISRSSFTKSLH